MVDVTEVCNLGCIHCTHPAFKLSDKYEKKMLLPELNKKWSMKFVNMEKI